MGPRFSGINEKDAVVNSKVHRESWVASFGRRILVTVPYYSCHLKCHEGACLTPRSLLIPAPVHQTSMVRKFGRPGIRRRIRGGRPRRRRRPRRPRPRCHRRRPRCRPLCTVHVPGCLFRTNAVDKTAFRGGYRLPRTRDRNPPDQTTGTPERRHFLWLGLDGRDGGQATGYLQLKTPTLRMRPGTSLARVWQGR